MSDEPFLSRWSRRKKQSAAGSEVPTEDAVPARAGTPPGIAPEALPAQAAHPPQPLPPIESLTSESDFTVFMKPEVDAVLKRDAFKKLITDPRFNVMDGLDVYIDDYSKADPLPEGWLEKMNQVKHLGIFREEPEEEPEADEAAASLAVPMQPDVAAFPAEPVPADTPGDPLPPLDVGKSGVFREGN